MYKSVRDESHNSYNVNSAVLQKKNSLYRAAQLYTENTGENNHLIHFNKVKGEFYSSFLRFILPPNDPI